MPTYLIVILCIAGLVLAVFGLGFGVLAGADPEGCADDYVAGSLSVAALGAVAFGFFGMWALERWLA